MDFCHAAGVKKVALTHHDPLRHDDEVDVITRGLREKASQLLPPIEVFSAAEGEEIKLDPCPDCETRKRPLGLAANDAVESAFLSHTVLVLAWNEEIVELIESIASEDELKIVHVTEFDALLDKVRTELASLVIMEDQKDDDDFEDFIKEIQGWELLPPLMVFTEEHYASSPYKGIQMDWLKFPVSKEYVRTRMHYWVMRVNCKFVRAQFEDEVEKKPKNNGQLDQHESPMEATFDRLSREVAEKFGVQFSVIALGERGKQWFKSAHGFTPELASKAISLGAGASDSDDISIVPDTLKDPGFSSHELVTGDPGIRFFAEYPVKTPDGLSLGTLAFMDTTPKELTKDDLILLKKLAGKVEAEVLKNLES